MRIGGNPPALTAALLLAGCANEGGYELGWTIGGEPAGTGCPRNGLDVVIAYVIRGDPGACAGDVVDRSAYSCNEGRGEGRLIEAGRYTLCAEGLSPAGERLTGVVLVAAIEIADGRTTAVSADLPAVPQCDNGIDDDGDGRIDQQDVQCSDGSDGGE